MNIGPVIRRFRVAKGLTLEQVALECGTDAGNISRLERDQQQPSFEMLLKVAAALSTPLSTICAEAEGRAHQADIPELPAKLLSNLYKLTPDNQDVIKAIVTTLLRQQKRHEDEA